MHQQIRYAQRFCEKFLQSQLQPHKVCSNLHLAQFYSLKHLHKDCLVTAKEKTRDIFDSPSFVNCRQSALKFILQLTELSCDESVVFDACIKWAKANCNKQNIDATANNLRDQLGDCFSLIRFKEMSMGEFIIRFTSNKGLFTSTELEDIFLTFRTNAFNVKRIKYDSQIIPNSVVQLKLRLPSKQFWYDWHYHYDITWNKLNKQHLNQLNLCHFLLFRVIFVHMVVLVHLFQFFFLLSISKQVK